VQTNGGIWRDQGVFYQIYPRSWADANGDGIGDLPGITARLDHLQWLGVDGVWLNPTMPSPHNDWGYDVTDYCGVDPDLGSVADLDALIAEAHSRRLRLLLDLVPNHTSDRHPWFLESRSSRDSPRRDWYVWADPAPGGGPPNNWLSEMGGGSAWTLDEASGQYYLHSFLVSQPDLNWWNPEVRRTFDEILRFWFDRGVDGFRVDVVHQLIHDRGLHDNPSTEAGIEAKERGVDPQERMLGQRRIYTQNRPQVHDILRRWRAICRQYEPERILVGETFLFDLTEVARYFGQGSDELTLAFNFPFAFSSFSARELAAWVQTTEEVLPAGAWATWTGSNHDIGRFPSRWCGGVEERTRCALMMLLTLRGTPFLYYGDEIGMTEAKVPSDRVRDPVGLAHGPLPGRDTSRTPMPWSDTEGAGFSAPGAEPWLPFGDLSRNVADQRGDPDSLLHLCRRLISLRRRSHDVRLGAYQLLRLSEGSLEDGLWAWRRGRRTVTCLNLSSERRRAGGVRGKIVVASRLEHEGEHLQDGVLLGPWEGVVVEAR
jgi:alpha-glucosidase